MTPISPSAAATLVVLWTLTAVTFIFVVLRLYTRLSVVHAYGLDDHFFSAAFVVLLVYDVLITLASRSGFGHPVSEIPTHQADIHGRLLTDSGQSLLVMGTIVAKMSMALLLRRIAGVAATRAQLWAIWLPIGVLAVITPITIVMLWVSCSPVAYAWDLSIPGGSCNLELQGGLALIAGGWSVLVDLWYAAFPWWLLWRLSMPKGEKVLIGGSMSFGIVAAACGIRRAMELVELPNNENYLQNIVPLIVWHGAEMCVTMISIGIAVCRPLYGGWLDRLQPYLGTRSSSGSRSWRKGTGDNHHESEFAMRTIGGTPFGVQGDGRSRGRDEEEAEGLRPLGRKESGSDSGITHSKKWDMDVPQLQPSDETRSDTASRHEMITHNSSLLVGSQPSDSIAGSQEHLITRNDASPDYESSREIEAGKGPDFSIPLNELGVSRMRQTS